MGAGGLQDGCGWVLEGWVLVVSEWIYWWLGCLLRLWMGGWMVRRILGGVCVGLRGRKVGWCWLWPVYGSLGYLGGWLPGCSY